MSISADPPIPSYIDAILPLAPLLLDGDVIESGHTYHDQEHGKWFSTTASVPREWAGHRIGLLAHISPGEPLLYLNGVPFQALDYNHSFVLLKETAGGGEEYQIGIEVYAGTAGFDIEIGQIALVRIDRDRWRSYHDELALNLQERESGQFTALGTVACVGHSHLDLAYLWALPNTRKKVGRTWASALRLLDEYPDFVFAQSQAFLYNVVKEDYPDLWEQVKARVAEGSWEITGGMWVEPDANMPGGESTIRQVLMGQAFFQREFGKRATVAWLPDTFGFPATYPQILQGCGITRFLTAKLSWNDTNSFPLSSFRWMGTDGRSSVLTHILTSPDRHHALQQTVATYNGLVTDVQLRGAWADYRQKLVHGEVLHAFGYGDGGGGPTREMVEVLSRLRVSTTVPACTFSRADAFFDRLETDRNQLPEWRGELYLENHRGTLTSQAFIKRNNRFAEILLRNVEIFSVLAEQEAGLSYPKEELDSAWNLLLTNQFHDILAGTIVPQAVQDARVMYDSVFATGNRLLQTALSAIADRVPIKEDSFLVFNPTDTIRPTDVVRVTVPANVVKAIEFADSNDALLPSQFVAVDKRGNRDYLVLINDVGGLGYQKITAYKSSGPQEESTVYAEIVGGFAVLENDFVRVSLNTFGEILTFIHKISDDVEGEPDAVQDRPVVVPGSKANRLVLYTDTPTSYDAWNIDRSAFDTGIDLSSVATVVRFAVIEEGPVRAGIEVTLGFRSSQITQRIYLYAHTPRLEMQTEVEWHEHQTLLCAHFSVAVNADRATYEIPFGYGERPTHENTVRESAQFEVSHHSWMDLSEGDYGVSILNDCKYGGSIRGNDMRLTLIKSGIRPDPEADQGSHRFTYAFFPHTGDFRNETLDEAHALNYPLLSRFIGKAAKRQMPSLPPSYVLAAVNDQGLVLDTIKRAEDGDGYIVRLYELFNTRGNATLSLGFDVDQAFSTNLLEEEPEPITVSSGGDISFAYTPHAIRTFRLRPRKTG